MKRYSNSWQSAIQAKGLGLLSINIISMLQCSSMTRTRDTAV